MSNSYFHFKQFSIDQSNCGMKVSTDACILGAWTEIVHSTKRLLDIGTGTGLLALMAAQKCPELTIDAIELDSAAATQAKHNVHQSPWSGHINIIEADATNYSSETKYDQIITNPPFFNNSLKGNDLQRNQARHTHTLNYEQLFTVIENNLAENGLASILLPFPESELMGKIVIDRGWAIQNSLQIKHTETAPVKRSIMIIGRNHTAIQRLETLVIKRADGTYTDQFIQLLKPYYLAL